ncbi:MAG TPA: imidazole glycerol phosphate synthase subunit HisH [Steroidobacteraceae bacterium]|nr:imidazole glycerol phosphate synthase subunit HisH [Steroidobacteraceae bacterium]
MIRLAIIDSGGANIASLRFAIERLGVDARVTTDAQAVRDATHVILPGVGAAADCMDRLRSANLVETVRNLRQPLLGVCVGMQLLFESSEEGNVDCLGLLPGRVHRFAEHDGLPVPHMGWNQLEFDSLSPLLDDLVAGDHVYFVHSYCAPVNENTVATTTYGERFAAVVRRGNVFGAQFHPERSARAGALVLRNFLLVS